MSTRSPYAFHAVTDVGRQREQNEDACGETDAAGGVLLIVCDGMGGHEAGEVASRIAVDAIGQIFTNSPAEDPAERLKSGFLVANQRILVHAEKLGLDSMGTTAVAAFVRDGEAWIGHVGDSRVYHLRGGAVLWRTADHTRVQKMVERGILSAEQAKTHEDANVVTRALGFARGEEQPEPDVASARALRDGDVLVLCSDGLHDLVPDDEIAAIGSDRAPELAAQALVDLANERGGHDNITVSVLRWGAPAAMALGSLDGTARPGKRKTALDEGSAAPAREPAAAAPATAPRTTDDDPRPRRALVLVIAGVALVGIAAAVFLMTRGDAGTGGGRAAPRAGDLDAALGGAAAGDARAPAPPPANDAGGAALPPLPDWTTDAAERPRPHVGRKDAGSPTAVGDAGAATAPAPVDAGVAPLPIDAGLRRLGADAGAPGRDAGAIRDAGGGPTRRIDAGTPGSVGGPPIKPPDAGLPAQPPRPKPRVDGGPA